MLVGSWAGDSEGWKKATRFFLKSSWTICVKPWACVLWHSSTSKYNWKNFEKLYDKLLTVNTSSAIVSNRVSMIIEMSYFCTVQYSSHQPPVTGLLCLVAQLCPTLCNPADCSLPGSSVHGDSPGKNTGVGCHDLLQGIFPTQGSNPSLLHSRWILYHLSHQGNQEY